jgi:hypothetical protein
VLVGNAGLTYEAMTAATELWAGKLNFTAELMLPARLEIADATLNAPRLLAWAPTDDAPERIGAQTEEPTPWRADWALALAWAGLAVILAMAAERADCWATIIPPATPVAPTRRLETAVDNAGFTVPVAPAAARADEMARPSDMTAVRTGTAPLESREATRPAAEVLDL